jgi:Ca2+/H+ antiporter
MLSEILIGPGGSWVLSVTDVNTTWPISNDTAAIALALYDLTLAIEKQTHVYEAHAREMEKWAKNASAADSHQSKEGAPRDTRSATSASDVATKKTASSVKNKK